MEYEYDFRILWQNSVLINDKWDEQREHEETLARAER